MLYVAKIKDTGEVLECLDFKSVFNFALTHAKDELRSNKEQLTILVELSKALALVNWADDNGLNHSAYYGEEQIGYLCVSDTGYTVDLPTGIYDVEREGK